MDDELDKFLYDKLNSEKKLPEQTSNEFKKIAYNTIYGDSKKIKIRHYPVTKVGLIACALILATTGIVYAGTVIVNKIWKEPEKTVGFYSEEKQENTIITEAEKQSTMSEKEAREKTKEILEKFGHKNEKIKTIELENNSSNYELYWNIETDNGVDCYVIRFGDDDSYRDVWVDKNNFITIRAVNEVHSSFFREEIYTFEENVVTENDVDSSVLNSEKYSDYKKITIENELPKEELEIYNSFQAE